MYVVDVVDHRKAHLTVFGEIYGHAQVPLMYLPPSLGERQLLPEFRLKHFNDTVSRWCPCSSHRNRKGSRRIPNSKLGSQQFNDTVSRWCPCSLHRNRKGSGRIPKLQAGQSAVSRTRVPLWGFRIGSCGARHITPSCPLTSHIRRRVLMTIFFRVTY